MRIKTLNGYDITLHQCRCKVDRSRFILNITIHREEHITETYLGDLSMDEMISLIYDLKNTICSKENNNV